MKPVLIELAAQDSSLLTIKKINGSHFSTPFHFHDYCELNYIRKSYGKRVVGDSVKNFFEGDLVLMSPNLPHIWYNDLEILNNDSDTSAEAIVTYFSLEILDKLSNNTVVLSKKGNLFEKAKRGLSFHGKTKDVIVNHLEKMIDLEGLTQVIEFLKIIDIMLNSEEHELLASIGYSHSYNEKDTERMNEVYKYLITNFTKPIALNDIAQVAHMTPPAFCTFFKKRTQKSFTQFLNELRTGHACKLLQSKKLSISDVCYESGFQNFANFNRTFKELIGKTPSVYRKEYLFTYNIY